MATGLRRYWRLTVGVIGFAAVFVLPRLAGIYGDWLWFLSLDYESVFLTILSTKLGLFVVGTMLGFGILYGGYRWTVRNIRKHREDYGTSRLATAGLAVAALLLGMMAAAQWETTLTYVNAAGFGTADPVFGQDVAFYVFRLPFYQFLIGWTATTVVLSFGLSLALYAAHFGVKNTQELVEAVAVERTNFNLFTFLDRMKAYAHTHAMAAVGTLLFLLGGAVFLSRYGLLFSEQGAVFGVGHAEALVSVPVLAGIAAVAGLAGLAAFAAIGPGRTRFVALGVAGVLVIALLGGVAGWAVQSYAVKPDEFNKERDFIEREIQFTRDAYALDRVDSREFPVSDRLTREQINTNPGTINNVRLWDWRPLLKTYNELQIFRTYYTFTDVDVDRYRINGSYREVMVAAREIDTSALPPRSQSWVNRHLVYTHGYGLTMSPARNVSAEGLPELYVKDIPPESSVGINITEPRIYYGENTDDYAIVNTGTRELDYPAGDRNVYTSYDGDGGVPLTSTFRKLAYSVAFGASQIFFSDSIDSDSRLQFNRDITSRVKRVAPFLELDQDPYIVTVDGKLYWIYDAYTTTDRYPYSRPIQHQNDQINYMRNSVKVVVDAYTGDMQFYATESDDPLIQTYRNAFPDLFTDMEQMPDSIREHVRYPEDIFSVQATVYRDYHMTDPNVFYNREDQWRIPNEILRGNEIEMQPYYIMMQLPNASKPEFVQILPFIPRGKENMIGWMAARSDPPNYGTLQAFQFSKQELIFGPMQIESRIDQNADISQQITLWSQSGSDVLRGNLLAIPIDDTIIYVEPLFLESREQGSLPELKRVIVAHNDRLTMQPTLDDALAVLFGEKEDTSAPVVQPGTLDEVRTLFEEAQAARQQGDFATYGAKIDEIEQLLGQGGTDTPSE